MRPSTSLLVVLAMASACAANGREAAPLADSSASSTTTGPATTTEGTDPAPPATIEPASLCRPLPPGRVSVDLRPRWTAGATVDLEIQETAVATGRAGTATASTSTVRVEVIEETDRGWILEWTADASIVELFGVASAEAVETWMSGLPPHRFRYELSQDRVDVRAVEVESLRLEAGRLADGVELFESPGAASDLRTDFASMDDQELGDFFVDNPFLFHAFEGVELSFGRPIEYPTTLPNALGGPAFPALTSIELTDLVDDDGCVAVRMRTVPDPAHFADLLADSFRAAVPHLSDSEIHTRVAAIAALDISDTYRAQFDVHTRRFHQIHATRRTSDGTFVWLERTGILDIGDKEPVILRS